MYNRRTKSGQYNNYSFMVFFGELIYGDEAYNIGTVMYRGANVGVSDLVDALGTRSCVRSIFKWRDRSNEVERDAVCFYDDAAK